MYKFYTLLSVAAILVCSLSASAQKRLAKTWADETEPTTTLQRVIQPTQYRNVQFDLAALRQELTAANGVSFAANAKATLPVFELPMPNGGSETFRIWETSCMHPLLAAAYPMIKTYSGQSIDHPEVSLTMDASPWGLHAVAHFTDETVYLDPFAHFDTQHYMVYNKSDFKTKKRHVCASDELADITAPTAAPAVTTQGNVVDLRTSSPTIPTGPQLRTYRLALSGTAEYSLYHSPTQNKAQVLAAMVTSINRVNGVYEREVAVHLNLIPNDTALIFFNAATDGLTNNDGFTMLTENHAIINTVIGTANYDLGHVFSTDGGGVAARGSVCSASTKGQGVTGSPDPVGDPFDIDYVVHELGHQFSCYHTFNGNQGSCAGTNRTATHAYEPGSGVSIMAYAGICGTDDIDLHSIENFHTASFDQVSSFTSTGAGNACAVRTQTGNTTPTVSVGTTLYTIPKGTPFALTASGGDIDGDAITYSWEEYDLGGACAPNAAVGTSPTFKPYSPTTSPTRYFPQLVNILNSTTDVGNILANYGRTFKFRCTVRDNHPNTGGVINTLHPVITVDGNSGPLSITTSNTVGTVWAIANPQVITWNVANTNIAPVNCANVRISFSTDGGLTFPNEIVASTPNTGTYTWASVANMPSTTCRVKVEGVGNIFFDINDKNFTIKTVPADYNVSTTDLVKSACAPSTVDFVINSQPISGFTTPINYTVTGLPFGTIPTWVGNPATPGSAATLSVALDAGLAAGTYNITVRGDAGGVIHSQVVQLIAASAAPAAVTALNTPFANATIVQPNNTGFAWAAVAGTSSYSIEVATDAVFGNIVATQNTTTNTGNINIALTQGTDYYWRVKASNLCGTTTSAGQKFTTGYTGCLFTAFTGSVAIPVTVTTVTSTLNIPDSYLIQDLNITNVNITHSYINDISFKVTGPTNASAALMPRICAGENNFTNISFDDASTLLPSAAGCPPTPGSVLKPQQPLSVFNGTNVNGAWKFAVTDNSAQDGGALTSWTVQFCVLSATPVATEDVQGNSNRIAIFPNPSRDVLNVQLEETIRNPVLNVYNLQGQLVHTQIGSTNNVLNAETWAAGMYILQVKTADGILSKKFIIQK